MVNSFRSESTDFMVSYGTAMASWARVEMQLHILMMLVMRTEQGIASEVFMHITSMDSRVRLLDKLFRATDFREGSLEEWKKLFPSVRQAIEHRNRLAHYQIIETTNSDGVVYGPTLEPHFKMGRLQQKNPETYDNIKLKSIITEFNNVAWALHNLVFFTMTGNQLPNNQLPSNEKGAS